MSRPSNNHIDTDIVAFANSIPPPPYPGSNNSPEDSYDLTPTPHMQNRPRLPEECRNPHLSNLPDDATIVKFQTIVREGREIVVGRIKVPTPGAHAHAFILRRYDTNGISLTTMFKVAFPSASEEDEKREIEWVKSSYDTKNNNGGRGSESVRLAGQWVSRHLAIHLAPAYNISDLVAALSRAIPDPNVAYRKSQRSQIAADELARKQPNATTNAMAVPSVATDNASPISKRQRRQSPHMANMAFDNAQPVESERRHLTLEATTTVTAPTGTPVDMEAEIQAAKQLVLDLKRELRLRAAAGEDLEDQGFDLGENSRGVKRGKGDSDAVVVSGGAGKDGRYLKKNKRVVQDSVAETARKVAWGALIFGLGVGAATMLPQFAASFF